MDKAGQIAVCWERDARNVQSPYRASIAASEGGQCGTIEHDGREVRVSLIDADKVPVSEFWQPEEEYDGKDMGDHI